MLLLAVVVVVVSGLLAGSRGELRGWMPVLLPDETLRIWGKRGWTVSLLEGVCGDWGFG